MNIRELLKAAKEFKPSEDDIKAHLDRVRIRQQEWEKEELERNKLSREFLERTYNL